MIVFDRLWPFKDHKSSEKVMKFAETFKKAGRSETIAKSHPCYVHVHASKTKEPLYYLT
jgi:hypothetical protein